MVGLSASLATAGDVLTFEGLQTYEPVGNYYNGGFGGLGSGPGPNYGITFGSDSLAIISAAAGGGGNFDGAPTMPTILFFLSGPGDVMDVPAGFTTGFSFYYSAPIYPGNVDVYSGLDGTGALLASISLGLTPDGHTNGPPCSGSYDYCPWVPIGVLFDGTAESVNFTGTANYIGFDNITLGSSTPGTGTVPEPVSLVLFSSFLGLAGLVRRRKS
jgi:hypothetical protein